MRKTCSVVVGVLAVAFGAAGQATRPATFQPSDVSKLSIEVLRELVKNLYFRLDKAEGEAATARMAANSLASERAKLVKEAEAAKAEAKAAREQADKLRGELAIWKPGASAADPSLPTINAAQLENLGEKYLDKQVAMSAIFGWIANDYTAWLPGTQPQSLVGFHARSGNDESKRFLASKEKWGEVLATLREGQSIRIIGKVVKLQQPSRGGMGVTSLRGASQAIQGAALAGPGDNRPVFGLLCERIEMVQRAK